MTRYAAALAVLALAFTPALHADGQPVGNREGLNATLWMQTAHEYAFGAAQVYKAATATLPWAKWLPSALADPGAPPPRVDGQPAIVLDLDETVLDNSRYQAGLAAGGEQFTGASWDKWVDAAQASLIPGALDFLRAATDQGYRIFYVTNRACPDAGRTAAYPHPACPQRAGTEALARRLGLPYADDPRTFLLRNDQAGWEASDKSARRLYLADRHKVVMLFGDDLGDFLTKDQLKELRRDRPSDRPVSEVAQPDMARKFGVQWFLLPNPVYGSWERALADCRDADKESAACYAERLHTKYGKLIPAATAGQTPEPAGNASIQSCPAR